MIIMENTAHNLGVTIKGDITDLNNLLEALYDVLGEEGEYPAYYDVYIRIMGLCYDVRHATYGHRESELVKNDIDEIYELPKNNLYLKFNTLWPEMIFICLALNDFINFKIDRDKVTRFDKNITIIRNLQSTFYNCVENTLSKHAFKKFRDAISFPKTIYKNYLTQYIDTLNLDYINSNPNTRLKRLGSIIEKIANKGNDYYAIENQIKNFAMENNVSISSIDLVKNYPEDLIW